MVWEEKNYNASASAALHFSSGTRTKHDFMAKAGIGIGTFTKKEVKREIERECHKQRKEFRDNTKSTDLPRAKQGKGMRT